MGMREKLIEVLEGLFVDYGATAIFFTKGEAEAIADHLIANGVTIPVRCGECKSCMFCYPEKQIGKEPTPGWYCKEQKSYRRPDDFCSYGERKDNGC